MTKLRIVCRPQEGPEPTPVGGLQLNAHATSIADCTVYAVGDDGRQVELTNVEQVIWYAGGNEPTHAQIRFVDVEIDADTDLKRSLLIAPDGCASSLCELCGRLIPDDGGIAACGQCIAERS